jgi:hypothetical protein
MMDNFENIREKDHAVLNCIRDGQNDVQLITEATMLNNSEVNYCFRKLSGMGLIEVQEQEGMVERVIDGTTQVFQAPKQATLTENAQTYLERSTEDRGDRYKMLDHEQLVERVHELEAEVEALNQRMEIFRKQVSEQLRDDA